MKDHQGTTENDEREYDIIKAAEATPSALSDAGGQTSPIAPLTPNDVPTTSSPPSGSDGQAQEIIALREQVASRDSEIGRWICTTQISHSLAIEVCDRLSSQHSEISAEKENVGLHLRMATRLAEKVVSRDERIAALKIELASRDEYITSLEGRVGEVEEREAALKSELEFHDDYIILLETRVDEVEEREAALKTELESRDDYIMLLETRVGEVEEQETALKTELDSRDDYIMLLETQVGEVEEQETALKTELDSRDDYIMLLETRVDEVEEREAARNLSNELQGRLPGASQLPERERIQHEHSIEHLTRHLTGARRAVACLERKLKEEEHKTGNLGVQLCDLRRRICEVGDDQRMAAAREHAEMRDLLREQNMGW